MTDREKINLLRSLLVECINVFRISDGFRNEDTYKAIIFAIDKALNETRDKSLEKV